MDLYTLKLCQPIAMARADLVGVTEALAIAESSIEGYECVLGWDADTVARDAGDGPRLVRPLLRPSMAASTVSAGTGFELPAGSYLFCQAGSASALGADGVVEALEWFLREAWWMRSAATGPVFLRLVREDGKTAVQVLRSQ